MQRRTKLEHIAHLEYRPLAIYIDDGVLNDNQRRGAQWRQLVGEFMHGYVGGDANAWAAANPVVFRTVWDDLSNRRSEFTSFTEFHREYAARWLRGMFEAVEIENKWGEAAERLYNEMAIRIGGEVDAAIEGAADAVRALHRAGYLLFMASGTPSWELRSILKKMGILGAFARLYGPDLVDKVKYGPDFYTSIFAASGVVPDEALVIESDREACRWARQAGAHAMWVNEQGDAPSLGAVAQVLCETAN